jgi:hypothetical protein
MTNRKPPRTAFGAAYKDLKKGENPYLVGVALAGAILVIAVVILLAALITLGAWNLGVVVVVAACGAHIGKITLGTAIFVNFALGIIQRVLHAPTVSQS